MQDSWQLLRNNNKQLALCLLFAPRTDRQLLADIFCFANELENAIQIPSEIILAAIRLQWWHDTIANMVTKAEVPLMNALKDHIKAERIIQDDLLALVALWQRRIDDSGVSTTYCFASCWELAARVTCGSDFVEIAGRIAHKTIENGAQMPGVSSNDLATLRRTGSKTRWLYLAGCLTTRRLETKKDSEDPLLIWRLLFWRFGLGAN